ncbi:hypothetical protein GCM10025860_27870 [Methanobacterium ferruginis]|nr:hypothetical protein GCM10025860_27870 [Methanobacterium ferruginis]
MVLEDGEMADKIREKFLEKIKNEEIDDHEDKPGEENKEDVDKPGE